MTETNTLTSASPGELPIPSHHSDSRVHQLGYRSWTGTRAPGWTRWTVIASLGIKRSWQNQWLKRMLFFAWLPALWFGLGFFVWEQAALYPEWRQAVRPLLRNLPQTPVFDQIRESVRVGDFNASRHTIWAWLLSSFFRYPQAVLMVLVIGMIAPPLISQDIRSRAFLLYFSRPIVRGEYLLGKMACVWTYLSIISAGPALAQYALGVLLSPSLTVVFATWDLPLRILAASLVLVLPTSALALCLSSLTQESRYAGFAWFSIWILGWFTYGAVSSATAFNLRNEMTRQQRISLAEESVWTHLSLYHTLRRVQSWVFGFEKFSDVLPSVLILLSLTGVSLVVLFRQISKPMRV